MPVELEINWPAIEKALIAGVSYQDVARCHGLLNEDGSPDTSALRKRVSRFDLPIPGRVLALARKNAAQGSVTGVTSVTAPDGKPVTNLSQGGQNGQILSTPTELAAKSLLERGVEASHLASQLAVTALRSSKGATFELENLGDVKTAMSIARTAAGMDKAVTAVQVNVWGGQGQAKSNEEWCDE